MHNCHFILLNNYSFSVRATKIAFFPEFVSVNYQLAVLGETIFLCYTYYIICKSAPRKER
jgi:hypothetical protein